MSYPPSNQPPSAPPPAYGGSYGGSAYGPPPSNFLIPAILVTVFCCLPLGVVAIIFAAQVNSKWAMGDAAGAQESARKAKLFTIWSAVVGLVVIVLAVILSALGAMPMYDNSTTF